MKFSTLSVVLASSAFLAACGGGGGGSTDGSVGPASPPVVTPSPNIVMSIPAVTYTPGSEELTAFTILNNERSTCGFGLLAQNTKLDTSAFNHARYEVLNAQSGHFETAGLPGFTGVAIYDRVAAVNFNPIGSVYGQPSESSTFLLQPTLTGAGTIATRGLLSAPYHLLGMFRGYQEAGVVMLLASTVRPGESNVVPIFNFGTATTGSTQLPGSTDVLTYPCQGSTGINFQLGKKEIPEPVPGRDLVASPLGHPIMVAVRNGQILGITSATLIKVSTGASVTLRAPYTKSTDTVNSASYYENEGFILPDGPLEPSTAYQATINGTNSGAAFTRTFTFTTGTGGQ